MEEAPYLMRTIQGSLRAIRARARGEPDNEDAQFRLRAVAHVFGYSIFVLLSTHCPPPLAPREESDRANFIPLCVISLPC